VPQEATSREISITDEDPSIVEKMIDYLYKLDYTDSPFDSGGKPTLLINAEVYAIAEKYNIRSLKALAKGKFKAKVEKGWNEEGFSLAIKEVYTSTPDSDMELRDLVCKAAEDNVKALLGRSDFRTSLSEINDFTVDLLDAVVKRFLR